MSSKYDEEVEIDGVLYSYRCDICWQELDETDIQFRPCNRCHLQVCLFCFNKHTNRKEAYSKTCPKCREPIDMEQIMKLNMSQSKSRNVLAKKLLSKRATNNTSPNTSSSKKRKRKKSSNKDSSSYTDHTHSHSIDIDEEIPKTDWKNYLKGRFISRDSIIVAPVIAKFNNEEAISDNFKAYGRITRINMWDDESAHIMYDKQYFADALVDRIQDVAVRYQGQFGLMSAKYHFRRPCEEFMDPERRCPMQCRKFHGPYYKLDFIPLDQYLDEEAREQWILERKKHVSGIVKARYKKFRKKFMDGVPLPIVGEIKEDYNHAKLHKKRSDDYYDEEYDNDEHQYTTYRDNNNNNNTDYYGNGTRSRYYPRYVTKERERITIGERNKNAITLKYTAMGKANKLLALDDSLQKHMRSKPNQPLPPSRPAPLPPHHNTEDGYSVKSESTTSTTANNVDTQSNSSIGSGRRTRPPIQHTTPVTPAQMRGFMATNPNLNLNINIFHEEAEAESEAQSKAAKVKSLMDPLPMNKITRAKSDDHILALHNSNKRGANMLHNNGHNRGDNYYVKGAYSASSSELQHFHALHHHKQLMDKYSHSSSNLKRLEESMRQSPNKQNKLRTVDLLKSLKKKKRKQRSHKQRTAQLPAVQPLPHPNMSTFKPHNNTMMPPVNINMNVNGGIVANMAHNVMNINNINPMNINMNLHNMNGGATHTQNMTPFHPFHPAAAVSHSHSLAPSGNAFGSHTHNTHNSHVLGPSLSIKPFKPPRVTSAIAKKSKLNANAASYKPLNRSTKQQPQPQQFKLPKMRNNNHTNNIKSFDIRNLGPLIADNDILNKGDDKQYAYDFSVALDETHVDLKDNNTHNNLQSIKQNDKAKEEKKQDVDDDDDDDGEDVYCYTASSDDSSDAEYDHKQKWTQDTLWDKVCDIVKQQRKQNGGTDDENTWCNWQNIRKLLKNKMSFSDWNYVKEAKLVKKVKAKFRMDFEKAGSEKEKLNEIMSNLLDKQNIRTKEAKSFADLAYDECGVIDLDLRISDIRNYLTDLLTQNTESIPNQYDTTIIAELGQILNAYQAWIDDKNLNQKRTKSVHSAADKELESKSVDVDNDEHEHEQQQHIKDMMDLQEPLFGVPFHDDDEPLFGVRNNEDNHHSYDHESDFYSRLLDEVQQKAVFEHEFGANPKELVMDYIGFNEHKDAIEDEKEVDEKHNEHERNKDIKEIKKKEQEIERQTTMKHNADDDDLLYNYEYSDDTEEDDERQTKMEGNLEENETKEMEVEQSDLKTKTKTKTTKIDAVDADTEDDDDDAALYQYDDDDEDDIDCEKQDDHSNGAIFSRCHSPPPRHRKDDEEKQSEHDIEAQREQEEMIMGENNNNEMDASDRHYYNARYPPRRGRYARNNDKYDKYHYQRYNTKNNKNVANTAVKMEWKKKENKEATDNINENEDK